MASKIMRGEDIELPPGRTMATGALNRLVKRPSDESGYLLSAAIDIGTSTSCYAFSFKSSPYEVRMNSNWTAQSSTQSYKTPTAVLTDSNGKFLAFGYEAERQYREKLTDAGTDNFQLYCDFKMVLYREKIVHKKTTMAKSHTGHERPLMDLYAMTLKYLKEHMLSAINNLGVTVMNEEIRWVLCVPATWTDKAKSFLRRAAYKGGLIQNVEPGNPQLLILLEATAAALYCQIPHRRFPEQHTVSALSDITVKPGSTYLVIDVGAGTVDYTAQRAEANGNVREIAIASGGDWGAGYINKSFMKLLRDVIGEQVLRDFQAQFPLPALDIELAFEQAKATVSPEKRSINLQLPSALERFMTNVHKLDISQVINDHQRSHGVRETNGYLVVTQEALQKLFTPTVTKICEYSTKMVIDNHLQGVDVIFLVGGFASSPVLQAAMRETLKNMNISVPNDARAAVVQGAVIYGHDPEMVIRIAKKTYGVKTFTPFDPERHNELKKMKLGGKDMCSDIFVPFVRKGEELPKGAHGTMVSNPVVPNAKGITVEFYQLDRAADPKETLYVDSPGVEQHGIVSVAMPDTDGGLEREVLLNFTFNDEITVEATDPTSGAKKQVKLKFDCETVNPRRESSC